MHSFTQYTPTRIVFGKETEKQTGQLAKQCGASRVFVVYGGGSVVRSGLPLSMKDTGRFETDCFSPALF